MTPHLVNLPHFKRVDFYRVVGVESVVFSTNCSSRGVQKVTHNTVTFKTRFSLIVRKGSSHLVIIFCFFSFD